MASAAMGRTGTRVGIPAVVALLGWLASLLFLAVALVLGVEDVLRDPAWEVPYVGGRLAMAASFATVGAVLAVRLPRNPIGWLLLAGGLGAAFALFGAEYAPATDLSRPFALPVVLLTPRAFTPAVLCAAVIVLLFPQGRLPRFGMPVLLVILGGTALYVISALLAPGAVNASVAAENPLGLSGLEGPLQAARFVGGRMLLVGLAMATVLYCSRLLRASGDERRQLEWLAYVATFLATALVIAYLRLGALSDLAWIVAFVALSALPVAIGIAVLRYRLYEIDVIISRTMVYVPLLAILGGTFAAGTLLLQRVFAGLANGGSDAAVVLSTLFVAGLFAPVRKSIESRVDRRFGTVGGKAKGPGAGQAAASLTDDEIDRRIEQTVRRVLAEAAARPRPGGTVVGGEPMEADIAEPRPGEGGGAADR